MLYYTALLKNDPDNVDLKLVDVEKTKKDEKRKRCAMNQEFFLVKHVVETIDYDESTNEK